MLVSLKLGADFSRGCAAQSIGQSFLATPPRTSRIDSERRVLANSLDPGLCRIVEMVIRETPFRHFGA